MISVIVYGRNDAHWSNIHKRAAISLNGLSLILDEIDDEIIFVDYNTPDDLQTFPEAIADTLTARARTRLRILRVRPEVHAPYLDWTPLPIVEAIARNVGIRRVNPANPWVLLTNTDCVAVPRDGSLSLSRIVQDLDEEFYCNPRYEIPETLWASVNRFEPERTLQRFVAWSHALRLRTVAYGLPETIFDYSGDFQLITSARLRDLRGVDERLLLIGGCDVDLAKRLHLLGVACHSLTDQVDVFHCSHTRGATPSSAARRLTNSRCDADWADVRVRWAPGNKWGLPDARLEEIRLAQDDTVAGFVQVLAPALADEDCAAPPVTPEPTQAEVMASSLHSLPYIADLLWPRAREETVGYLGLNRRIAEALSALINRLGFETPLVQSLLADPNDPKEPEDPSVVQETCRRLSGCAALVIDFSLDKRSADGVSAALACARLATMSPVLARLAEDEGRPREGGPDRRRLFIFLNLERSRFKPGVEALFDLVVPPLMTRVTYGFVRAATPRRVDRLDLARTLGRPSMSVAEFEATRERLRLILHYLAVDATGMAAFSLRAARPPVLQLARLMAERAVAAEDRTRLAAVLEAIEQRCPFHKLQPGSGLPTVDKPGPALSKLACLTDWDDPDWQRWAHRLRPGPDTESYFERRDYDWDRAQIFYVLDRLGLLSAASTIAVHAGKPDPVVPLLGRLVGAVDVWLDPAADGIGQEPGGAGPKTRPTVTGRALAPMQTVPPPTGRTFSAVIALRNLAQRNGRAGLIDYLRRLDPWLASGGLAILTLDVAIDGNLEPPILTGADWHDGAWLTPFADQLGYHPPEPVVSGLDPGTWDCFLPETHPDLAKPIFIRQKGEAIIVRGLLTLQKRLKGQQA